MVYGTIVVDPEAQRVVEFLPDREVETVAACLRAHPEIEVVARDRCEQYAEAARCRHSQNLGDTVQRVLAGKAKLLRTVAHELAATVRGTPAGDRSPLPPPVPDTDTPPRAVLKLLASPDYRASA
jgi:hypothetical protein